MRRHSVGDLPHVLGCVARGGTIVVVSDEDVVGSLVLPPLSVLISILLAVDGSWIGCWMDQSDFSNFISYELYSLRQPS
jgi:hypothetical protein